MAGASVAQLLLPIVCAFILCALILFVLLRTGWAWSLATDVPNQRSLHTRPTPRVGGWGIIPAVVVAIAIFAPQLIWVAAGAGVLAVVSQIDDRRGLPARIRFGAHLLVVGALVVVFPASVPWWLLAVVSFLLLWLVNLYNFMDGADGLAGGMAMFGFGAYSFAAFPQSPQLACAAVIVVAAAVAFLLFNFHPARIFLGDAGSIPLGFLAGALGYWGWRAGVWPIWFPAIAFSPFIADASVTLLRRLLRGEKFWEAHREHYYQRMVRLGMGHAGTVGAWYGVMAAGIMLAWYALRLRPAAQWCVVAGWFVVLCLMGVAVDLRWRRFQSTLSEKS